MSRVRITNVMDTVLYDCIAFANKPRAPWHNTT